MKEFKGVKLFLSLRTKMRTKVIRLLGVLGVFFFVLNTLAFTTTPDDTEWVPLSSAKSKRAQWVGIEKSPPPRVVAKDQENSVKILFEFYGYFKKTLEMNQMDFTSLSIPGCGITGDIGNPALPFKGLFVEIPYGVEPVVEVTDVVSVTGAVKFPILPQQPPEPDTEVPTPPFKMNRSAYINKEFLPTSPVEIEQIGFIRGRRVVFLKIQPFQYRAVTGETRIFTKMTINLVFSGKKDLVKRVRQKRLLSPKFEAQARRLIVNYKRLEETHLPEHPTGQREDNAADYLIIADDSICSNCGEGENNKIEQLARWKTKKGYLTRIALMSEVGTTSDDIRSYIQNAYDTWTPAPTYVLLIGDHDTVPSVDMPAVVGVTKAYSSDHPYTLVDGDDYWSDICIGRLSVESGTSQCIDVINKLLDYDQSPDTVGSWYNNSLLLALFQDSSEPNCIPEKFYVDIVAHIHDYLGSIGQNITTVLATQNFCGEGYHPRSSSYAHKPTFSDPLPYNDTNGDFIDTSDLDQQRQSISDAINGGVGLVIHRDHGAGVNNVYWSKPRYNSNDVNMLENGTMTPVVFSINCGTGKFRSGTSIAEVFQRKAEGGAVGVIAPTRSTWGGFNELLAQGAFTSIWPHYDPTHGRSQGTIRRMGEVLNFMKMYLYTYVGNSANGGTELHSYEYHWFGDPEMEYRSDTPSDLTGIYHPAVIAPVDDRFELEGAPDGALVGLSQEDTSGELHPLGQGVSRDNTAVIDLHTPVSSDGGPVYLTVTNHDLAPYETQLPLCRYFVDVDVDSPGDGTSWANAFDNIQEGIDAAASAASVHGACDVWVAKGIYYTYDTDPTDMVLLKENVHVYGGFSGTENSLYKRNWMDNATILSGYDSSSSNKVYHVVSNWDMNGTNDKFDNWTLDGFFIICGDANSPDAPNRAGGGMYIRLSSTYARARVANCAFLYNKSAYGGGVCINNSSPTITDTYLWNNESSYRGGGLYVYAGSPSIENCNFSYNTAASYGGAMYTRYSGAKISNSTFFQNSTGENGNGGGLYTYNRSNNLSPAVDGCEFIDNSAKTGGGVYNFTYRSTTSPVFTNCTFEANQATSTGDGGGGMYNYDYDSNIAPRLINCLFYRNNAINNKGGAMYNYKRAGDTTASPTITNSTFAFNYSQYSPGGVRNWRSSVGAINNIFWGNDFVGILDGNVSDSTVSYCALQQEWTGSGDDNIFGQDPLFDDPIQDDFRITESSPCINAGTDASAPDSDIVQYPRDEEPDIGAYEYQGKCVFYVSTEGKDSNSGFSWQDAFSTVQKAIDAAQEASDESGSCEVWVKEGTYYIFKGNKTDTVRLQPHVYLYGGFAGNETSLGQRNLRMHHTILDGSDGSLADDHRVYHVVTGSDESGIDGFIIKNGRANGTTNNRRGAGMLNNESSPEVSNCIFIDNHADSYGGGIYCLDSYPTIKNCLFSRNLGSYGGGIYVR
ncbi:MAG: hypothetical protein JSV88_32180, partial [Candidatus Aminicenantes bacterium]